MTASIDNQPSTINLFGELPLGARFEFRGRRYEKLALSMARDEERCGNIFLDHTEVCWHRRPGEEPCPARKPDPYHWTDRLSRSVADR